MPFARHTVPINEGEDILSPPTCDDPRVKPWMDFLVELGVLNTDHRALKHCRLSRGCGPEGYVWRMEWTDHPPA